MESSALSVAHPYASSRKEGRVAAPSGKTTSHRSTMSTTPMKDFGFLAEAPDILSLKLDPGSALISSEGSSLVDEDGNRPLSSNLGIYNQTSSASPKRISETFGTLNPVVTSSGNPSTHAPISNISVDTINEKPSSRPQSHIALPSPSHSSAYPFPNISSPSQNYSHSSKSRLSSPKVTLQTLIDTEHTLKSQYLSHDRLVNELKSNVVQFSIIQRFYFSLSCFHVALFEKLRFDHAKFPNLFQQAVEFRALIKDQNNRRDIIDLNNEGFLARLPKNSIAEIIDFLTLIKSSPGFVSCALLKLCEAELDNFVSSIQASSSLGSISQPTLEPFDKLVSLHRTSALDILFFSLFPPDEPSENKVIYFSTVFASLLRQNRGKQVCYSILGNFMLENDRSAYLKTFEPLILSILQDGEFLTNSSDDGTPVVTHAHFSSFSSSSSPSSSPATEPNSIPSNESIHSSFTFPPVSSSMSSLINGIPGFPNSQIPGLSDFETKRQHFLIHSVNLILQSLNSTANESIPKNLLKFTQAVVSKLEPLERKNAFLTISVKYFFLKYVYRMITSPEHLGILADYYISDHQRQRILVPIFQLLHGVVTSVAYERPGDIYVNSDTKLLVESILMKFQNYPDILLAENLPDSACLNFSGLHTPLSCASSSLLHSPSEHYFTLCPSDIITVAGGLFPSAVLAYYSASQTKPSSSRRRTSSTSSRGHRSSAFQQNFRANIHGQGSTYSSSSSNIDSNHSSVTELPQSSDFYPAETESSPFDTNSDYSKSTILNDTVVHNKYEPPSQIDNDSWDFEIIKESIEIISSNLFKFCPELQSNVRRYSSNPNNNQSVNSNSNTHFDFTFSHSTLSDPFSERWQVFKLLRGDDVDIVIRGLHSSEKPLINNNDFELNDISEDNFTLSDKNIVFPNVITGEISQSQSISPVAVSRCNMNCVKNALNKLISEFDIPLNISKLNSYELITQINESGQTQMHDQLSILFTAAKSKCLAAGRYSDGHIYSNAINSLKKLLILSISNNTGANAAGNNGSILPSVFTSISNHIISDTISSLLSDKIASLSQISSKTGFLQKHKDIFRIYNHTFSSGCDKIFSAIDNLRLKAWYVLEVRTSSVWKRAKNVAVALNKPGADPGLNTTVIKTGVSKNTNREPRRHGHRHSGSSSTFSLRRLTSSGSNKHEKSNRRSSAILSSSSVSQIHHIESIGLAGMFAPKEFAGNCKLSDREADSTRRWLQGQGIQNFCSGEEIIHRFCCEVDDLVKRVFGDALSEMRGNGNSILTSSQLFRHDLWRLIQEIEGPYRNAPSDNIGPAVNLNSNYGNFSSGSSSRASLYATSTPPKEDKSQYFNRHIADPLSVACENSVLKSKTKSTGDCFNLGASSSSNGIHTNSQHGSAKHPSSVGVSSWKAGLRSSQNLLDMLLPSSDSSRNIIRSYSNASSASEDLNYNTQQSYVDGIGTSCGFEKRRNFSHLRGFSSDTIEFPIVPDRLSRHGYENPETRDEDDHVSKTYIDESKKKILDEKLFNLQMSLTGLICSDLGSSFWSEGSETDLWMQSPLTRQCIEHSCSNSKIKLDQQKTESVRLSNSSFTVSKGSSLRNSNDYSNKPDKCAHISATFVESSLGNCDDNDIEEFTGIHVGNSLNNGPEGYDDASFVFSSPPGETSMYSVGPESLAYPFDDIYKDLLKKLSAYHSPMMKLKVLCELEELVVLGFANNNGVALNSSRPSIIRRSSSTLASQRKSGAPTIFDKSGQLNETIASVEAKRVSSGINSILSNTTTNRGSFVPAPATDMIVDELQRIFERHKNESKTLFKDLQIISAFVPSKVLDLTSSGKAFWDVSLAALSMKQDTIGLLTTLAAELFQYQTQTLTSTVGFDNELKTCLGIVDGVTYNHEFLSKWSLADCGWLWSIAAKEDNGIAQRELAIMHMSHPQLTPVCMMPFTKLNEVFTPELLEQSYFYEDLEKFDPIRMAIIKHWMKSAAKNNDNIANEYLMQDYNNAST